MCLATIELEAGQPQQQGVPGAALTGAGQSERWCAEAWCEVDPAYDPEVEEKH